jgi:hypothetical protein
MRKKRSISNKPAYRGKERYRKKKNIIHKRRKEKKPEQREVK